MFVDPDSLSRLDGGPRPTPHGQTHNEWSIHSHVNFFAESLAGGIADVGRDRFGHYQSGAGRQGAGGREPNAGRVQQAAQGSPAAERRGLADDPLEAVALGSAATGGY